MCTFHLFFKKGKSLNSIQNSVQQDQKSLVVFIMSYLKQVLTHNNIHYVLFKLLPNNHHTKRASRIIETVWKYFSPFFYSKIFDGQSPFITRSQVFMYGHKIMKRLRIIKSSSLILVWSIFIK